MLKSCIVAWGANLKKYIISEEKEYENDKEYTLYIKQVEHDGDIS